LQAQLILFFGSENGEISLNTKFRIGDNFMFSDKSEMVERSYGGPDVVEVKDHLKISLLTEIEWQQLATWNATQQNYPEDACVPQLVERQAAATPEAAALVMGDQSLNYGELNERANQLAHYLQASGVRPNMLVGICIERSLDMVVGLLGILKAGSAYVPLDPSHPTERLHFMLHDTRVAVLVTKQHIATNLSVPGQGIKIVCLDADAVMLSSMSKENPVSVVAPDDLAYTIYTSGSTGQPKGVQITHRSLLNLVFWHRQTFEVTAADRATQFFSPGFDVTGEELWPHLTIGASVYLIDEETRLDPRAMCDWLVKRGITITILPTALVESLIVLEWPSTTPLRVMLVGGDKLYHYPPPTLPFALINNYGPTETTVVATFGRVFPNEHATTPPSIGRPISNAQVYILDEQLRQVPTGDPGELHIGGVGLARGYLNRSELTAEKFIPNPFSNEPGARLYKTGDLACYLPDGQIAFIGRADFQIKIRGYRIEPNEIINVLNRHPAIETSVVVAREDTPGNKRLVAYISLVPGEFVTSSSLRNTLLQHLPYYMVPSVFVVVDEFPMNSNGKVSRSALPMPTTTNVLRDEKITAQGMPIAEPLLSTGEIDRSTQPASKLTKLVEKETFVAPKLLIQQQLVLIWEELLDVSPIGVRDNFFNLGGHSLLAAQLVDRIEHVLGRRIALSTLFSGPTIEQLAEALQKQENAGARTSLLPVQVGGSKRPFFFLHGDWTGGAFYCFTLARVLGTDQPLYVLEPYKFGGLQVLPSLETVAAAHIESLRAIQPQGPYLLGGFCNGGFLAYEMAQQLQAAGEQVDLLALVTPASSVQLNAIHIISNGLGKLLRFEANKQANLFLRVRHALRHVYRHLRPTSSRVQDFDQLLAIDPRLNAMFPPVEALYNDYVGVFTWLASRYEPGIYPGRITCFWASEEPFIENAWRPVIGAKDSDDVENHVIPGTHMSCVSEHIQVLAERLNTCVIQVQEKALSQKA
jgi:amino acid adenylation domain-containing protein